MNFNIFDEKICSCGKFHTANLKNVITGNNALTALPHEIGKLGVKKVFLMSDINTDRVAGSAVCSLLEENKISYSEYIFSESHVIPDEHSVGSAFMHFDKECDCLVAIGSGVLNDVGKILSATAKIPYIIIGTAPSMDGYASDTSSMEMDGVKISLFSKCPDVIIGDTDILKTAPDRMLLAGLGDMIAKYVSVCEWRISHEINGEYYCEKVAELVRDSLRKCVSNPEGLLKRDDKSIQNVFEGLVMSGLAMKFAGVSRPASGVEHYFSHIWDMRSLEKGMPSDLHGIQCAIGTLYSIRLYERLSTIIPDKTHALESVKNFSYTKWCETLDEHLGKSAKTLIALEENEKKFDAEKHKIRLQTIIEKWDTILNIVKEELPSSAEILELMTSLNMPVSCSDIGISEDTLKTTFKVTKDIRNKYIISHLAWDLGLLDYLSEIL